MALDLVAIIESVLDLGMKTLPQTVETWTHQSQGLEIRDTLSGKKTYGPGQSYTFRLIRDDKVNTFTGAGAVGLNQSKYIAKARDLPPNLKNKTEVISPQGNTHQIISVAYDSVGASATLVLERR